MVNIYNYFRSVRSLFPSLFPLSLYLLSPLHKYTHTNTLAQLRHTLTCSLTHSLARSFIRQPHGLALYIDHQRNVSATMDSPLVRNQRYTANNNEVKRGTERERDRVLGILSEKYSTLNSLLYARFFFSYEMPLIYFSS